MAKQQNENERNLELVLQVDDKSSKSKSNQNRSKDASMYQTFDESVEKTIRYQSHPIPFRICSFAGLIMSILWFAALAWRLRSEVSYAMDPGNDDVNFRFICAMVLRIFFLLQTIKLAFGAFRYTFCGFALVPIHVAYPSGNNNGRIRSKSVCCCCSLLTRWQKFRYNNLTYDLTSCAKCTIINKKKVYKYDESFSDEENKNIKQLWRSADILMFLRLIVFNVPFDLWIILTSKSQFLDYYVYYEFFGILMLVITVYFTRKRCCGTKYYKESSQYDRFNSYGFRIAFILGGLGAMNTLFMYALFSSPLILLAEVKTNYDVFFRAVSLGKLIYNTTSLPSL